MGTNCGDHPRPITTNRCGPAGEIHQIENFCSLDGKFASEYCGRMSDQDEWVYDSLAGSCAYSDCNNALDFGLGCCNGCCGIAGGSGLRCRRVKFAGDPLRCCLQDYVCRSQDDRACFTDDGLNATCSDTTRDQSSLECRDRLYDYCTGTDVSISGLPGHTPEDFYKRWYGEIPPAIFTGIASQYATGAPCYKALFRVLYRGQQSACLALPGIGIPDAQGYIWAQRVFQGMLNKYISLGGTLIASESSQGADSDLNGQIWNICNLYPGICQFGLRNYCSNRTTEMMIRDPTIQPWCGCYMPASEYSKYTDLYQINLECTPTCNSEGVIPLGTNDGVGIKRCRESLCVIDDVAIQLYNTRIAGSADGLSFSQICPTCASQDGATCSCILTGLTLKILDGQHPSLSIAQNCGAASECFAEVTDADGKKTQVKVPCSSDSSYDPYSALRTENQRRFDAAVAARNIKIVVILVVAVIIVAVLYFVFDNMKPRIPTTQIVTGPIRSRAGLQIGSRSISSPRVATALPAPVRSISLRSPISSPPESLQPISRRELVPIESSRPIFRQSSSDDRLLIPIRSGDFRSIHDE